MTTGRKPYPVHLRGELTMPPSRWLWIFKWLLAIPHYFILGILTAVSLFLTLIAFFGILFTGKYPKGIFDFNVGVIRWTWRAGFYSYSALGTDKYPPFSLASDPDYPADFSVDYPEKLSRGLIFIKWLLAVPHLIIVGIFNGWRSLGLITVMAVLNGIIILFSGSFIGELFYLLVGMNRWTYRVMAYVLLMRDEYPPFWFDD